MKIWDLPTTEKDAIEFLQDRGLLHKTRVCRDGHEMKLYHKQRPVWECRRCRQQQGVRSGNWFSNTKLSFVTIVRFIYCWAKEIEEAGFEHFKVNHKYNFVDPETGCNTQKVERMWGSAKWRNKKHRGTARHHLESYFAEFMWRKMIGDGDVFEEIILAWGKYWALD